MAASGSRLRCIAVYVSSSVRNSSSVTTPVVTLARSITRSVSATPMAANFLERRDVDRPVVESR